MRPPAHDAVRLRKPHRHVVNIFWYKNIISYCFAVGAAVAVKMTSKAQEEIRMRTEMETEHLRSEISSLRYQIQPHFFFNTLNSIYSLIDIDKEQAKDVLLQLSKLMRYVLYTGNQNYVDLEAEVNFIESYANLMRVRLEENLDFKFEVDGKVQGKVAPLLFISLVENAFKHGIDPMHQSKIHISLHVSTKSARLEVENSFYPKSDSDESGSGIGISNTEKRLSMIYPEGTFTYIHELRGDQYYSLLEIPVE